MSNYNKNCIICNKSEDEIPLTKFDYKNNGFWICSQHIPILIHDPKKMDGLLPGAENFEAV